jgi:hypothetical protein
VNGCHHISCHAECDEVLSLQRMIAGFIRQSVDSDYHSISKLSHTRCNTTKMQGSMYLTALIVRHYELNSGASITQHQQVEPVISLYWKGAKDKTYPHQFATVLLQVIQERRAYEQTFKFTSGSKETMKSVQETSIRLWQQVGRNTIILMLILLLRSRKSWNTVQIGGNHWTSGISPQKDILGYP